MTFFLRFKGFGYVIEEVMQRLVVFDIFNKIFFWVGLCFRGEGYRKVLVYIDFKCYS